MLAFQSFPSPRLLFIFPWALTWQKPNGSRIINKKTESTGLHVFELTRYFLIAYSGYCKWKTKVKWPGRKLMEDLYPFAIFFLSLNSSNSLCRYGKQGCGVRGFEGLAYYFSNSSYFINDLCKIISYNKHQGFPHSTVNKLM